MEATNIDDKTVSSFGLQWATYDQARLPEDERTAQRFQEYFAIFPWNTLPDRAVGADVGCGSGRWALRVAPRIGKLHCIDASEQAIIVARRNLGAQRNCAFHVASVDTIPLPPGSMDFVYSLGVLHHVPDTMAGIRACVSLLKPGAPFLVYLYYALDQRPWWFRAIWKATDIVRRGIARLPYWLKRALTEVIAIVVYWPVARFCAVVERLGGDPKGLPLSWYRDKSLYITLYRCVRPLRHSVGAAFYPRSNRDDDVPGWPRGHSLFGKSPILVRGRAAPRSASSCLRRFVRSPAQP